MGTCTGCNEEHYFVVSYSATSMTALQKLISLDVEALDLLDQNVIQYEGIIERCGHGDVQDCDDCDYLGKPDISYGIRNIYSKIKETNN